MTLRLTLLFATVSISVLLLLGLVIGIMVEQHFEDLDMELLNGTLNSFKSFLHKLHSPTEIANFAHVLEEVLLNYRGLEVAVFNTDGTAIFATKQAAFPHLLLAQANTDHSTLPLIWQAANGHTYRGIAMTAAMQNSNAIIIAVAIDMLHHQHFMHSFLVTLWLIIGFAALLAGFLGWLAAHRGMKQLRNIRQRMAVITAEHLDQRLPMDFIPIELAEVVATLNAMLARLEQSFRRLADFSADLAHELRTPVSNLLTQTQVILTKTRTIAEYRDVLASNTEEFERLSLIISDMLFLAKTDHNLLIPNKEPVDLSLEVQSLVEFYASLIEDKAITVTCTGNGVVLGNRLMLRRAINNLLSNAMRHTPLAGNIRMHIEKQHNAMVVVTVENTGESIAPEHLARLFDRFYRVDAARHYGDGFGLGLAITRAIAQAHGGDVIAHSQPAGARFAMTIPVL